MAMQSLIKIDRNHNELERFIHFYNVNRNQNLVLIQTGCQNNCHSMQVRPRDVTITCSISSSLALAVSIFRMPPIP